MRKIRTFGIMVMIGIILNSCAPSIYTKLSDDYQLTQLTMEDVEKRLGLPENINSLSDGREVWTYYDYTSLVPVYRRYYFSKGILVGGNANVDRVWFNAMMR